MIQPLPRLRLLVVVAVAGVLAMPTGRLTAQSSSRPATVISVNPFLPLAGYFQGEFERRVRDNFAVALAGSYINLGNLATNVDLKFRLYPQEKAPYGLGLAAGIGAGRLSEDVYQEVTCMALTCPPPGRTTKTTVAPAFSVEIHYQWLLGKRQNTAVGFGFGAKRYFIANNTDQYGGEQYQEFVPTGRITIGWAFGK